MLVTINTDASFHPKEKHAGYAFWIVSNLIKIKYSNRFKEKCFNPTDAEAKCIVNALVALDYAKSKRCIDISKIIINTDCLNAVAIFEDDKEVIKKYARNIKEYKPLYRMFSKIKKSLGVEVEFRHVKAHTGIDDARSFVNEWCDAEAKKHMRNIILTYKP